MGDGQRLKAILKEKGTNVRQVAKKAEVSPTTLYTIIQKDTDIKLDLGLRLAMVLGVSVSDISSAKSAKGVEIQDKVKVRFDARGFMDLSDDTMRRYFNAFASYSAAILKAAVDVYEQYHYIDEPTASHMREDILKNETWLIKKMEMAWKERLTIKSQAEKEIF